jgi:hypothetical protein
LSQNAELQRYFGQVNWDIQFGDYEIGSPWREFPLYTLELSQELHLEGIRKAGQGSCCCTTGRQTPLSPAAKNFDVRTGPSNLPNGLSHASPMISNSSHSIKFRSRATTYVRPDASERKMARNNDHRIRLYSASIFLGVCFLCAPSAHAQFSGTTIVFSVSQQKLVVAADRRDLADGSDRTDVRDVQFSPRRRACARVRLCLFCA